ncbi:MAG: DNA polymerase III subunit delta [Flavobacteriales bacterium]|nr:DNA polymerase III subunit delta [Flavobacteriales bacterium]MCB9167649.1 DNA polymerase III subunit delta [Flavobacteriales bacterium]
MNTLDAFKKVMGELRGGMYRPVYLLHGEEPFFVDRIAGELERTVVEEHARDFDLTVVYARDTDPDGVRDVCLRYPMMGERQLVVLREAQSWRIDQLEKLESYVNKPIPSTILVICYKHKKVDGRRSFAKTITKNGGLVFTSDRLRDEHLPGWVQKYVAHMGRKIGPSEARLLSDHLGSDLGKVTMEVEKLCLVTEQGGTITADTVQRYVGISKDYNTFELQNAIGARDRDKALRIAHYFGQDIKDHPLPVTLAVLNSYLTKLVLAHTLRGRPAQEMASTMKVPPFFLKDYQNAAGRYTLRSLLDAQHLLREYDMRSKGVGGNEAPGELLTELLVRLMDAPAS